MGNMANKNRFWSAKCSNWSENGQWPTVISSTEGIPIIRPPNMPATDVLIFTVSVIGKDTSPIDTRADKMLPKLISI